EYRPSPSSTPRRPAPTRHAALSTEPFRSRGRGASRASATRSARHSGGQQWPARRRWQSPRCLPRPPRGDCRDLHRVLARRRRRRPHATRHAVQPDDLIPRRPARIAAVALLAAVGAVPFLGVVDARLDMMLEASRTCRGEALAALVSNLVGPVGVGVLVAVVLRSFLRGRPRPPGPVRVLGPPPCGA